MKSESIKELAAALSKAQASITGAVKDSKNPFFKSSYADLQSVWDAIREPLTKNGLSIAQTTQIDNGGTALVTILMHSSGEWLQSTYPINPIKADPQGLGSAITYARRYSLQALCGVCPVDDDGEAAQGRNGHAKPDFKAAPKDNGKYIFSFGKFSGKSCDQVEAGDLESYLDYLEKGAAREPQKVSENVRQAIFAMREFLAGLGHNDQIPF